MANTTPQQAEYTQMLQQWKAQQAAAARRKQDLDFMRSLEQFAYCPVTGGNGATATYSTGTTLYFDLPPVPSGFAKGLIIKYNLAVKPATAGGASYSANPAAPWNIFSEIQVQYNGTQIRTHPYFLKIMDVSKGFLRGAQNRVLAGNNDATMAANIVGTTGLTVNTDNTWQGQIYLPFNALSEDSVAGLLPVSGSGTHAQLKLTTPAAFLGNDPLINPVSATGGSSPSITIETTSTISVDMVYLNGMTLDGPTLLPPPPSIYGPTAQYYWEPSGTSLSTNAMSRYIIQNKMQHFMVVTIILDGNQSSAFTALSNLNSFELTGDPTGSQKLMSYNVSNNIPIYDFFDRFVRRRQGQDFDPGVIPWIIAPARGTVNSSNRMGSQALNMYPGGFPTATYGVNVTTVGSPSGYSARTETFLLSLNHQGLGLQQVG